MAKIHSDNTQTLTEARKSQILPSRCQICLFKDTCLIASLKFNDIMSIQKMDDCYCLDSKMREFFRLINKDENAKKALWAKIKELR